MTPRERCEGLTFNKRKTTLEGVSFLQLDILCAKWIADSFLAVNAILGSQKHSNDSKEDPPKKNEMTNGTMALNTNKDQWEIPEAMTSNPENLIFCSRHQTSSRFVSIRLIAFKYTLDNQHGTHNLDDVLPFQLGDCWVPF